jgi:predicted nucleotidyltransferase
MRLDNIIKNNIIKTANKYFGRASVFLFGSRVDDNKKGGDIDLFIETTKAVDYQTKMDFLTDIYRNTTQRKIDLIIKDPSSNEQKIFKIAKTTGIKLC